MSGDHGLSCRSPRLRFQLHETIDVMFPVPFELFDADHASRKREAWHPNAGCVRIQSEEWNSILTKPEYP
jgi:hypothetical protein